jgi:protein involved in polysaccharide export with SLBB domain
MMHKIYFQIIAIFFTCSGVFSQINDLEKMRLEYEQLKKGNDALNKSNFDTDNNIPDLGTPGKATISPYLLKLAEQDSLKREKKYFGYDFFTKRDSVSFWENLPTLSNYLLGPGDELIISIWGETQLRSNYTISREGSIYDEKVGLLILSDKSLREAKVYLKQQFSKAYATLAGKSPSTFIDISLGKLSSINVNFVGEVNYPGIYPIHPFSTLITGLIQAGGIDTTGTLRNIIIKRDGSENQTVDLYKFFLEGTLSNSIQLRDQDIVVVQPRYSTIYIDSAITRPGVYEAKKNETVYDLIKFSGGLRSNASEIIGLSRIIPIEERKSQDILNKNYYINYSNASLTNVEDGDIITALKIYKSKQLVEVLGQVKNPGKYYFYNGMKILDLIKLSGGLEDLNFSITVDMDKALLIRRNANIDGDDIITVSLTNILMNNQNNLKLQNFDKLVVYPNKYYFERGGVILTGEVNAPGYYPLSSNNETLKVMIEKAGGLSSRALDDGISIYRDKRFFENPPKDKLLVQNNPINQEGQDSKRIENINETISYNHDNSDKIKVAWQGQDVLLMPGDSILVKENIGAVYVLGEVYNPGILNYNDNKSIRYYIDAAGGINNYGNRNNVIVIYPNGITKPWKKLGSPKIESGSTIVVYRKANIEPFDLMSFTTNITSIISSLVTTYILVNQLK